MTVAFQRPCGSLPCSPALLLPLAWSSPAQYKSIGESSNPRVTVGLNSARFWLSPLGLWETRTLLNISWKHAQRGAFTGLVHQGSKQTISLGSLFSFSLKANSWLFAGFSMQFLPPMYAGGGCLVLRASFCPPGLHGSSLCKVSSTSESPPEMEGACPGKQEGKHHLGLFPMMHI